VTLRLFWGLFVCCLCWKLYKVWTSMLRTERPSFVTLWVVCSYVKLTCTACIGMETKNTTIVTSHNFEISLTTLLILCTLFGGTIWLLEYNKQHFLTMANYITFTKHASWLVFVAWSLKKLGHNLCKRWKHNAFKLCYN
jgi:hypothetical protein